MITWMQKHHKYLIVTIWISVIAFVGAGFVGWGSYNYGSISGNTLLVVEDTQVNIDDFRREYAVEVDKIKKEYPNIMIHRLKFWD